MRRRSSKERLVRLVEAGQKHIIVDLSEATLLEDSDVLHVVRANTARLEPVGGSIALVLSGEARRTYEMAGFDRLYRIYGSRDEAWAAASGGREAASSEAIEALTYVIDLGAEMEPSSAAGLEKHLAELVDSGKKHFVVDLSRVTHPRRGGDGPARQAVEVGSAGRRHSLARGS
jgi:anti-anti-sigma regulatory factor